MRINSSETKNTAKNHRKLKPIAIIYQGNYIISRETGSVVPRRPVASKENLPWIARGTIKPFASPFQSLGTKTSS